MNNIYKSHQGGRGMSLFSAPPDDGGFQPTFSPAPNGPSPYPAAPAPSSGLGWKKGCLIAGLAAIVLATGIVILVFTLTGPAVKSANGFLALLGEGNVTAAYEQTAEAFQENTDQETFEVVVQKLGLNDFSSASWSSRSVENSEATLEGTITTKSGDQVPLTMTLMKDGDEWKVFSFTGKQAGAIVKDSEEEAKPAKRKPKAMDLAPAQPEEEEAAATNVKRSKASADKLPPKAEMQDMARESILALDKSIRAKDFTYFFNHTANLWQKQTTPEDLKTAFQDFIDNDVDMSAVADADPVFDEPPSIDSDDRLNMNGVFSTDDYDIKFELKYAIEKNQWKLVSINVNVTRN